MRLDSMGELERREEELKEQLKKLTASLDERTREGHVLELRLQGKRRARRGGCGLRDCMADAWDEIEKLKVVFTCLVLFVTPPVLQEIPTLSHDQVDEVS